LSLSLVKALLLAALASGGTYYYMKNKMALLERKFRSLRDDEKHDLQVRVDSLESRKKMLEQNLHSTQQQLESVRAIEASSKAEVLALSDRHQAKIMELIDHKKKMREAIQRLSLQQLREKFGPGPHRVELVLDYPPDSNIADGKDAGREGGNHVVFEMAPETEMPHSVYWFLEQVSRGLYDGASFHINQDHVVQAGPVGNWLTPPNTHLYERFKESGYESVLFQEYNKKVPHYKYTVGYAGRPGGPDFYISTMNNVQNHGPKQQHVTYGDDPEDADPCIAKVVEGIDTVERLHRADVHPGGPGKILHFVAIRHMKLLPK